ncbi:MAG TPA: sugar phosphate isomerase/epimerase, partial [Clostridiales bacterium]|nr:sugar phosphate isomerase/epimerase [Clostridiales bacterium]
MIKLGVNSVLFGGFDFDTAAKYIALAGYDGLEISAIKGMCEHLDLDDWKSQENMLKETMEKYNLSFLA